MSQAAVRSVTFMAKPNSPNRANTVFDGVLDVKFTGASLVVLVYPDTSLRIVDLANWESLVVSPAQEQEAPAIVTL